MTWWQILIIAGSVITGALAGISIVRLFFKMRANRQEPGLVSSGTAPTALIKKYTVETTDPGQEKPGLSMVRQAVARTGSSVFTEIEYNLEIARTHRIQNPLAFYTGVWDSSHGDIANLSSVARSELGEIYLSMRLANNLVWLINEFGDSTQELSVKYVALCSRIAERLSKVMLEEFNVQS